MVSETKLAEMLCTRLCHDLTGPVGAISNGVEFLSEEEFDMQGQAIDLIAQSATQCVNRIQFYRSAYGRVGETGESDLMETRALIAKYFVGGKMTLDWPPDHMDPNNVTLGWKQTRLLLNMIIIVSGTLIRGGEISVRLAKDSGNKSITVSGTSPQIKWEPEAHHALMEELSDDELTPEFSQIAYTHLLVKQISWDIEVEKTHERFQIKVYGMLEGSKG